MCGRFAQNFKAPNLAEFFEVLGVPDSWESHFNLAPTQSVAAVRARPTAATSASTDSGPTKIKTAARTAPTKATAKTDAAAAPRELVFLHWGLIPAWAKDRNIATKLFNARSETAAEKPSFRAAFGKRRCIVPANCFYEWQTKGKTKQPMLICGHDRKPLALAGLWEHWADPVSGVVVESCSILTTAANEQIKSIHHRMPVILGPEHFAPWLSATTPLADVQALCVPCPEGFLDAFPVSTLVNDARRDDAAVMAPAAPLPEPTASENATPRTNPRSRASRDEGQGQLF